MVGIRSAPRTLTGKVAVVTGATSGVGRALVMGFVRERMRVVLADLDREALAKLARSLRADGHDIISVPTDVTSAESVEHLARAAVTTYGSVHVLCNTAAGAPDPRKALWELAERDWQSLIGIELGGVVHGIRAFVPRMVAQSEWGHIVNLASTAGLTVGGSAYGAAKHGVVSLSENLHVDLQRRSPKLGVTCLCPSVLATNIVDGIGNRSPSPATARTAEVAIDAIRTGVFYALIDEPRTSLTAEARVRARMEAILERRNPTSPEETPQESLPS